MKYKVVDNPLKRNIGLFNGMKKREELESEIVAKQSTIKEKQMNDKLWMVLYITALMESALGG